MKSILSISASSLLLWLALSGGGSGQALGAERLRPSTGGAAAPSFLTDIGSYAEPSAEPSIQLLPPPPRADSAAAAVTAELPTTAPSATRGSFLLENAAGATAATPLLPSPESLPESNTASAADRPGSFFLDATPGSPPRTAPELSRLELPIPSAPSAPASAAADDAKPSASQRATPPASARSSFLLDSPQAAPSQEPVVSGPNIPQGPMVPPMAASPAPALPQAPAAPAKPIREPAPPAVAELPAGREVPRSFLLAEPEPEAPLASRQAEPADRVSLAEAEVPQPERPDPPAVAERAPDPISTAPILAEALPETVQEPLPAAAPEEPAAAAGQPSDAPEQELAMKEPVLPLPIAAKQDEPLPAAVIEEASPVAAPAPAGTSEPGALVPQPAQPEPEVALDAKEPEPAAPEGGQRVAVEGEADRAEPLPMPSAPEPKPLPAPPSRDLSPWALVDAGEVDELPVFDASMPVISNEVARLQLEEWQAHITKAVGRHPSVKAAGYAERESISAIGEAKAQLYPQVSVALNTDFNRSIRDEEPYPTVSGLESDDEIRLNPSVTVRQMLFDGGATSNRGKAATARSEAARERRVSTEEGVALRAAATMIELAKAQEQLEFAHEHLAEVSRLRDMIRERVNAGRDAPSEMLQMNSRIFEARNQVVLLEGRRAEAGARHEEVFGEPPVVMAFPDVFAPIPMSLQSGLDEAIRRNPDLQSARAQVEAASSEYRAAKGAQLPRLELEGSLNSYDLTRNGTDYYDSFIGLRISHSILDGGLKRSTKEKSQSQLERARAEYDNTERAVELALKRAYANRASLIPQYKALQAQLDHKRETRRAYEEQFLAGRRPLNDLVAAQQQVLDTALRVVDFKSELHRQHFSILSLVGELFTGSVQP